MPKVQAQGRTIECVDAFAKRLVEKRLVVRHRKINLRKLLLQHGIDLYNGKAKLINCRGIGSCGTCAVKVEGKVSAVNWRDKTRRSRSVRLSALATSPFSYNRPA